MVSGKIIFPTNLLLNANPFQDLAFKLQHLCTWNPNSTFPFWFTANTRQLLNITHKLERWQTCLEV